jgi:DNA-directed RNA polymerase subunit RPC12/RpoP
MSYRCPKCGKGGVITVEETQDDPRLQDETPDYCDNCGWKYKYRWHDHPLFNENIIAVCLVLILLFYFW